LIAPPRVKNDRRKIKTRDNISKERQAHGNKKHRKLNASNTYPIKNRGWSHVFCKGKQFLHH